MRSSAALGMTDLADFRAYCLAKPNVTEGTPFGADTLGLQSRWENVRPRLARRGSAPGELEMRS